MFLEKALIGLGIGVLCGIIPIAFGFLTKHRVLGIIGMLATASFGVVFSVYDKSPFTAICVALVFVIFNFASNKSKNKSHDHDNDADQYDNI